MPYIYQYYNIRRFTIDLFSKTANMMANVVNALIEAINEKTKLLRFVVVVPDADILRFINFFSTCVSMITGKCLNWIINCMERIIDARKNEFRKKKPGSIAPNEPKIIWVKMLDRPNKEFNDLLSVRDKYNSILEDLLSTRCNHYIMDVNEEVCHPLHYTFHNTLNDRGKNVFWEIIDCQIEEFDYHKAILRPQAIIRPKTHSGQEHIPTVTILPVQPTVRRESEGSGSCIRPHSCRHKDGHSYN